MNKCGLSNYYVFVLKVELIDKDGDCLECMVLEKDDLIIILLYLIFKNLKYTNWRSLICLSTLSSENNPSVWRKCKKWESLVTFVTFVYSYKWTT